MYPRSGPDEATTQKRSLKASEIVLLLILISFVVLIFFGSECLHNHESGRLSASLSNAKQLALSTLMYTADNDEHCPSDYYWMDRILPYVKNKGLYEDPAMQNLEERQYGYAFFKPLSQIDVSTIADPMATPLIFQSTLLYWNATSDLSTLPKPPRYGGANIFAFLDGHGKAMTPTWPPKPIIITLNPEAKNAK